MRERGERGQGERGGMTVAAVLVIVAATTMCLGVARLGAAAVLRARAETAADAAALAAAAHLAQGESSGRAAAVAADAALDNGARLVSCDCRGTAAEVEVALDAPPGLGMPGAVRARARAEVDLSRAGGPRVP
jgi:secretion/DNA translocation related TadE-like protein